MASGFSDRGNPAGRMLPSIGNLGGGWKSNRLEAAAMRGWWVNSLHAKSQQMTSALVEEVQLFAWLEADGFARCDADFGASAGVAADARLAGLDGEDAEAA